MNVEITIPSALASLLETQGQPLPQPVTGIALIDTGASRTCVHREAIVRIGVNPIGLVSVGTAGGQSLQELFPARLRFPGEGLDIEFSSVVGVDLSGQSVGDNDILVLVGRDVLSTCVLIYNGPGGFFSLAF